ncbi:MAG: tetratricopeptide repeat protein [Planctomycetota bacterium]
MPTNEEMYDAAIDLQQQGDLDGAIGRLQELIEQASDYALAHAALSVFFSRLEKHDEAVEHAQRVCQLEPEDPFSFVAKSLICQKAGLLPEAEQALMEARQAQMGAP